MTRRTPKVAIVHDWLVGGGAEKVVEQLHILYPEAPIFTSYCSPEWRQKLAPGRVITGYLQHWPFSRLRKFLPVLRQRWFAKLDLGQYDIVITSSGAEAKGARVRPEALHINYCHAPTHYYWLRYDEYIKHPGFGVLDPLARLGLKLLIGPMRRWDYAAAQQADVMVANSNYIKEMVKRYYKREATVIHPPVDVERFKVAERLPRKGFVVAGRQTPYKRIDLAVAACTKLNARLLVIGKGPAHRQLQSMAGPTVSFLEHVSDSQLPMMFQTAEAFIFPNVDDFGITPVEAMAAGTPVVAYQAGGALDYVVPGKTGEFFKDQTIESLAAALKKFKPASYKPAAVARHAEQFAPERFRKEIQALVEKYYTAP